MLDFVRRANGLAGAAVRPFESLLLLGTRLPLCDQRSDALDGVPQ